MAGTPCRGAGYQLSVQVGRPVLTNLVSFWTVATHSEEHAFVYQAILKLSRKALQTI